MRIILYLTEIQHDSDLIFLVVSDCIKCLPQYHVSARNYHIISA